MNAAYALTEKPIAIIVPTYNNAAYCIANLESLLAQQYTNYHIYIIVDYDEQADQTAHLLQEYLEKNPDERVSLYINKERRGALANKWYAVHQLPNHYIVVDVDGDDFLPLNNPYVLQTINYAYHQGAWATWGSYKEFPTDNPGYARPVGSTIILNNAWRQQPLPLATSHLRTYYAGLFKNIALHDLWHYQGLFPAAGDIAYFWPVLEQAGLHAHYIPDYLYRYNIETPNNDFKVRLQQQLACYHIIKSKTPYTPLADENFLQPSCHQKTADLFIFSYNRPLQLNALLESLEQFVRGLGTVHLIYRADAAYQSAYDQLKKRYCSLNFVKQSDNPRQDFKPLTLAALKQTTSDYILFAVDDIIVKDYVDCAQCIETLERTKAYGFYLRLGTNLDSCYMNNKSQPVPYLFMINEQIGAWAFQEGAYDWNYPHSVDMTLYRKQDIMPAFEQLPYTSPNMLEGLWSSVPPSSKLGLCFKTSKIINLPINIVQQDWVNRTTIIATPEQLLNIFNHGYILDRAPLHGYHNKSAHMEYIPTFVRAAL